MPRLLFCIVLGGRQREEAGGEDGCRLLVSAWSSGFPRMAND